jgi:hypothetical protein
VPPLASLTLPLRVQFQGSNGKCWQADFSLQGLLQNDGEKLKAKSD